MSKKIRKNWTKLDIFIYKYGQSHMSGANLYHSCGKKEKGGKMIIRKANIKDFKKLKETKKEFFLHELSTDHLLNPKWLKSKLGLELKRQLKSKNCVFFIAEEGNKIIGYSAGEIETTPAYYLPPKRGHLFNIYISRKFRGHGLGKKLAGLVLKWFDQKKIKWIRLCVYSSNVTAYKFYRKLGFRDHIVDMKRVKR